MNDLNPIIGYYSYHPHDVLRTIEGIVWILERLHEILSTHPHPITEDTLDQIYSQLENTPYTPPDDDL